MDSCLLRDVLQLRYWTSFALNLLGVRRRRRRPRMLLLTQSHRCKQHRCADEPGRECKVMVADSNCCPSRSSSWLLAFLLLRNPPGDSSPQFSQNRASLIITRGKCQRLSQCPDCFRLVPSAIGREPEIPHQVGY